MKAKLFFLEGGKVENVFLHLQSLFPIKNREKNGNVLAWKKILWFNERTP